MTGARAAARTCCRSSVLYRGRGGHDDIGHLAQDSHEEAASVLVLRDDAQAVRVMCHDDLFGVRFACARTPLVTLGRTSAGGQGRRRQQAGTWSG